MKTTALALTLLSAVSAAPAALTTRQSSTEFDVTGLYAQCTPHSSLCFFDLSVAVSPTATPTKCSATAYSYQSLPEVPSTACQDPTVAFSYTFVETGGADLTITYEYESGRHLTGKHFIPADQIVWVNTQVPTGAVQSYAGPKDFVVGDLTVSAVL